jgi:hypothetical protein
LSFTPTTLPGCETQEARLSLFTKGSYTKLKNALVRALLGADFYITDRRYIGFEADTGYHHYAIDVAQRSMNWRIDFYGNNRS